MGTAGNRKGFKVFSINTTIRNPQRNIDFLRAIANFEGLQLNTANKLKIYHEFIKNGVYIPNIISNSIKNKIENNISLSDNEIFEIINANPQATGNNGRVMTQVRALKDLEFITLRGKRNNLILGITNLGKSYLDGDDIEIVYTKSLLGMHYGNINRKTALNEARPFLNTIFVLDYLNQYYKKNKPDSDFLKNGILFHEFGGFILSMKDCNFKKAAENIIEYRNKFEKKINSNYFKKYFKENSIIELEDETFLKDYPDEVMRKFSMTGLFEVHGRANYSYIRFVEFSIIKINQLLDKYKDYKYEKFSNELDYENYVSNIFIPWEFSNVEKEKVIVNQLVQIKLIDNFFELPSNLKEDEKLKLLDIKNSEFIFRNMVSQIEFIKLYKELSILSKELKSKSEYELIIPEPVRLEWLMALLFAKQYGYELVKPSMRLNSDGTPKGFAGSGKADIIFEDFKRMYILEATMLSNQNQQVNSETTSVSSHLKRCSINNKFNAALLVAPKIHNRVAQYYQFMFNLDKSFMLPISIKLFSSIVENNETIESFTENFNKLHTQLINSTDIEKFTDFVNERIGMRGNKIKDEVILSPIIKSPYVVDMIGIPLVGSAPCGNPLLSEENIEEYIQVEKSKIKPGAKYFIIRADGDSMNKVGINDKDLVLCRFSEKGETGDKVVALLGGENVTIKYYDKKDGRRILLPKSTNSKHQQIISEEGDIVQGIVQEVLEKK